MSLYVNTHQQGINFSSVAAQQSIKKNFFGYFFKMNFQEIATSYTQFNERVIKKLNECETVLDKWIPPLRIQNSYDQMVKEILQKFNSPHTNWNKFSAWLDNNGQGHWFSQLATFLAKLPLKPARNIVRLLANIVKIAVLTTSETVMHPMKAVIQLAKLLVELAHTLIQPETWTRLGCGLIGSSLSTLTVASNPLAVISVGIGAALALIGISAGTLKTVLIAQKDKRLANLQSYLTAQAKTISEDLLTAYCLGLLFQAVQRIMRSCQEMYYNRLNQRAIDKVNNQNQAIISNSQNTFIDQRKSEFLEKYGLPEAEIYTKGDLNFSVRWRMDYVKHGDLKLQELSEGKLVIENIQTGTLDSKTYIPGKGTVITKTPIYENFFGYNVPVKGWIQPPLQPLPQPIPVPVDPILTLDARMAAPAQTVNDYCKKD